MQIWKLHVEFTDWNLNPWGTDCIAQTRPLSWLLMSWLLASPLNLQSNYKLRKGPTGGMISTTMPFHKVLEWNKAHMATHVFQQKSSEQRQRIQNGSQYKGMGNNSVTKFMHVQYHKHKRWDMIMTTTTAIITICNTISRNIDGTIRTHPRHMCTISLLGW